MEAFQAAVRIIAALRSIRASLTHEEFTDVRSINKLPLHSKNS